MCAVVAGETAREMRLQVRQGLRKTRTLELRLDYLRNVKEREVFLSWLRRKLGETASKPRYLRTVRGVGIKLVDPFRGSRDGGQAAR